MSEFITITEAIKITGKSKSTIRRFVLSYNDNDTIIKKEVNERNRPLYKINKPFILSYFNTNISNTSHDDNIININESIKSDKKVLMLHEKLLNQKKLFTVILISVNIIFVIIFIFSIYYHCKILNKLDRELNFYKKYQETNQKTYNVSKQELKNAYGELLEEKQKNIEDLQSTLKEYKTNSTVAEKHINTLEREKDKLITKLAENT
jgi:hypothetical protein